MELRSELESSILFEVPKEQNLSIDKSSKNINGLLWSLDINNNIASNHGIDRSHNLLIINNPSQSNAVDTNSNDSNQDFSNVNPVIQSRRTTATSSKKKVIFQGVPKYSPINIDTISLRKSLRIATQKKKQLDQSLNHVGLINIIIALEEENDSIKANYSFKEAMNTLYKKEFVDAIMKEIQNYTKRNN